jgi:superfamily I DNA and/or RNA helicase
MVDYIDSVTEFRSLLDYYIACLEREDISSLKFNYRSEGKRFFSNFFRNERFFIEGKASVALRKTPEIENFLRDLKLESGKGSIFYGYPLIINPDRTVSPLFFVEIFLKEKGDVILATKESVRPEFNHYVLQNKNYSHEEIENIRAEMDEETNFMAKMDKVCDLLKLDCSEIQIGLGEDPIVIKKETHLFNKSIIYLGERGGYTRSLLKELEKLKEEKSQDLKTTSLGIFFNKIKEDAPKNKKSFLEAFRANESQEKAIESSFKRDFNVITGPPGTGKSQVVLNIIANVVRNDKTVLFASKNNQAVDVVNKKLKSVLSENLVARMGNSFHRRIATIEMRDLFQKREGIKINLDFEDGEQKIAELNKKIELLRKEKEEMARINDSIEETKGKIDSLAKEIPYPFYCLYAGKGLEELDKFELESDMKSNFGKIGIIRKLIKKIMYLLGIDVENKIFRKYVSKLNKTLQSYLAKEIDLKIEDSLNWILKLKQIELLNEDLAKLSKTLNKYPSVYEIDSNIDDLVEARIVISREIFENYWLQKLKNTSPSDENHVVRYVDLSQKLENNLGADKMLIWKLIKERESELESVLPFFPVWTVTNLSARGSLPLKENLFDLLVIDEASQCDIPSALPLMFRAKQVVVIGDPKQLSHISTLKESQDKDLASRKNIGKLYTDYSFKRNSIYDISERLFKERGRVPVLLKEHYRCHKDIINFSNIHFYNKDLDIRTKEEGLNSSKKYPSGIMWIDVKGKTVRKKSWHNKEEVEEIIKILKSFSKKDLKNISFGVVTIFKDQMELIKNKIKKTKELEDVDITVGTCHRFQGDEKDIIFFSPAVAQGIKPLTVDWINKYLNLTNVAVTRARSNFIVVGDMKECRDTGGVLKFLVEYIESNKKKKPLFDSAIEAKLYKRLVKEGINVIPQYETKIEGKKLYKLDFALFINNNKYDIEIDGDKAHSDKAEYDFLRDEHLRMEGWKVRRFRAVQINKSLGKVVDEIKRLC